MIPLKEIINTAVIIMIVVWVIVGYNQSKQNTEFVQRLENVTVSYSDTILSQIIENQHTIIGNLTDHRAEVNNTLFHLDDEIDEILRLSGSNATFNDDFKSSRESGHISSLK